MKYKFGSIIVNGSGKIGGSVVSRNHYGTFTKTKVSPTNPQSSSQLAVRSNFLQCIRAWDNLTDTERLTWFNAARELPVKDRFGDTHLLSGYNLFLKCNQVRLNLSLPLLSEFVAPIQLDNWSVLGIQCFSLNPSIFLFLSGLSAPSLVIQIYATGLLSQGVNYVKGQLRLIGTLPANSTFPVNIYQLWATKFESVLSTGLCIHFLIKIIDTSSGVTSHPVKFKSIIGSGYSSDISSNWVSSGNLYSQSRIGFSMFIDENTVIAGSQPNGYILKSIDKGISFSNQGQLGANTNIVGGFNLGNQECLLGGSTQGDIWKSSDNGESFARVGYGYSVTSIISFCKRLDGAILAGTSTLGKIIISYDNGNLWTEYSNIIGVVTIYDLLVLPNGDILAATASGAFIYKSFNGGLTWFAIQSPYTDTTNYYFSYLGNGIVLGSTVGTGGIIRSIDYGNSWQGIGQFFAQNVYYRFAYIGNGVVFVGTYPNGLILRSTDYGLTWVSLGTQFSQVRCESLSFNNLNALVCGTRTGGIVISSNF